MAHRWLNTVGAGAALRSHYSLLETKTISGVVSSQGDDFNDKSSPETSKVRACNSSEFVQAGKIVK